MGRYNGYFTVYGAFAGRKVKPGQHAFGTLKNKSRLKFSSGGPPDAKSPGSVWGGHDDLYRKKKNGSINREAARHPPMSTTKPESSDMETEG